MNLTLLNVLCVWVRSHVISLLCLLFLRMLLDSCSWQRCHCVQLWESSSLRMFQGQWGKWIQTLILLHNSAGNTFRKILAANTFSFPRLVTWDCGSWWQDTTMQISLWEAAQLFLKHLCHCRVSPGRNASFHFSHPCQHLLFSVLFIAVRPGGVRGYLIVAWICIALSSGLISLLISANHHWVDSFVFQHWGIKCDVNSGYSSFNGKWFWK